MAEYRSKNPGEQTIKADNGHMRSCGHTSIHNITMAYKANRRLAFRMCQEHEHAQRCHNVFLEDIYSPTGNNLNERVDKLAKVAAHSHQRYCAQLLNA